MCIKRAILGGNRVKFCKIFILCAVLSSIGASMFASAAIVTYIKQPPQEVIDAVHEKFKQEQEPAVSSFNNYMTTRPLSKLAEKAVQGKLREHMLPKMSGFLSLYGGFSDYSNADGLIAFPLRHTTPKLYMLITKRIKLETIKGTTISHTELVLKNDTPARMYKFEKHEDENGHFFWRASEEELPKDGRINPITMVILTNPRNLYIPLGDFITTDTPQMILPYLYVVGSVENDALVLSTMDIKQHFEPIQIDAKTAAPKKNQKLITNQ